MNNHSARFIHDDHIIIFIHDLKRDILRHNLWFSKVFRFYLYKIPLLYPNLFG
jgi:hypothetical protein